jgi:hypothetical protein
MPTLFIHVGPPKTGTSAIQHLLRSHDDSVVIYPKTALWADGSHHNLAFNFYGDFRRPEVVRIDIETVFDQIATQAHGTGRNILISSEQLVSTDVGRFVTALRRRLDNTWCVEIILVCREHYERAASLYNQAVKDFVSGERRLPGDYLRVLQKSGTAYAEMVKSLRRSGYPLTVLNYHPVGNFTERFLRHIGFQPGEEPASELRNMSMSVKGLIAVLAANTVAADAAERARCFAALRRMRKLFAPSELIFDAASMRDVLPGIEADRTFLEGEFGLELPPVPSPNPTGTSFELDDAQLADIAVAAAALGDLGDAIVSVAQRFVRQPSHDVSDQ